MFLRLEQTDKDEILGYKWIEVLDLSVRVTWDSGRPRAWVVAEVKNNKTEENTADWHYHNHLAWDDIEQAIKDGGYVVKEMKDWPTNRLFELG